MYGNVRHSNLHVLILSSFLLRIFKISNQCSSQDNVYRQKNIVTGLLFVAALCRVLIFCSFYIIGNIFEERFIDLDFGVH